MTRTLAVEFPDTTRIEKWQVVRAGIPGAWERGWFAVGPLGDDRAAWFPTQSEAFEFARGQVSAARTEDIVEDALARWGIKQERPTRAFGEMPTRVRAEREKEAAGGRARTPRPREAEPVRRGRGRPAALSPEQGEEIVMRHARGESIASLALLFGVSQNTVRRHMRATEAAA